MSTRILLVEDDKRYASRLKKNLEIEGYETVTAFSGEEAFDIFTREEGIDLVLSDIKMPGMSGLDLLQHINESRSGDDQEIPVVLLTSVDSVRVAVDAMKQGAADYITKDADRDEIVLRIEKVLSGAKVRAENRRLKKHIQISGEFGQFIAESQQLKAILDEIDSIADACAGVLIEGETGVGKELIARRIHEQSPRSDQAFIEVNCAAIPTDNLFQSEVFGHEKGAFTGASGRKRGKLELADEGILFLDEIGDMPLESQGKILRALETQEFERLGGNRKIKVDIAVIAATNKNLLDEVRAGRFRQDLLYRLDIIRLRIPPLRDRTDDIVPLAVYYFEDYAQKYRRPLPELTDDARRLLERYSWPGNVRELKNLVERIIIRNRNRTSVDEEMLQREGLRGDSGRTDGNTSLPDGGEECLSLEEIEKRAIVQALEKSDWVQAEAAKLLLISPDRIHSRIKKYGLSHPSWRTRKPSGQGV